MSKNKKSFTSFVVGLATGYIAGILTAPKKGEVLRQEIKDKVINYYENPDVLREDLLKMKNKTLEEFEQKFNYFNSNSKPKKDFENLRDSFEIDSEETNFNKIFEDLEKSRDNEYQNKQFSQELEEDLNTINNNISLQNSIDENQFETETEKLLSELDKIDSEKEEDYLENINNEILDFAPYSSNETIEETKDNLNFDKFNFSNEDSNVFASVNDDEIDEDFISKYKEEVPVDRQKPISLSEENSELRRILEEINNN